MDLLTRNTTNIALSMALNMLGCRRLRRVSLDLTTTTDKDEIRLPTRVQLLDTLALRPAPTMRRLDTMTTRTLHRVTIKVANRIMVIPNNRTGGTKSHLLLSGYHILQCTRSINKGKTKGDSTEASDIKQERRREKRWSLQYKYIRDEMDCIGPTVADAFLSSETSKGKEKREEKGLNDRVYRK